ncbi:MAG TPA: hypothetical protein VMH05_05735 [Bryobacteraceae bacterium]|nr:hypothetical protein [Bryobacteraceae bacterium]
MPSQQNEKSKTRSAKPKEKSALESAAEAIGSTLGSLAVSTGLVHPETSPKSAKPGKLQKSNKTKLPRKLKKAAAKKPGGANSRGK